MIRAHDKHMRQSGMLRILAVIVALAVAGFAGYMISSEINQGRGSAAATAGPPPLPWIAAAPGKVEPKSGEIRIGTSLPGRVLEVLIGVNDKVEVGELLIRVDDEEARARLAAAEAEAAVRKQERDSQPTPAGREDIRRAEDAVLQLRSQYDGRPFRPRSCPFRQTQRLCERADADRVAPPPFRCA